MPRTDYWGRLVAVVGEVRPGEGRLIAIFMAFTFLQGLAGELAQVATYSLLLDSYDATVLPWVYMGVALLVTTGSFVYGATQQRLPIRIFLPLVVAFNAISYCALWLALWLTPHPWLRIALAIWIEVPFFLNGMVFWEMADRIFDIRQVKRLFGPQTIRLDDAIVNDLRSASGRVAAFTQGQRYVRLADLTEATRTSELVSEGS